MDKKQSTSLETIFHRLDVFSDELQILLETFNAMNGYLDSSLAKQDSSATKEDQSFGILDAISKKIDHLERLKISLDGRKKVLFNLISDQNFDTSFDYDSDDSGPEDSNVSPKKHRDYPESEYDANMRPKIRR